MGLLDGIVGNVIGSMLGGNEAQNPFSPGARSGGGAILMQLALSMLQQNGGVEGVLNKFRESGLGQHADSWVSTGENMGISADQLQQVFGSSALTDIAARLGLPKDEAGSAMAQVLPEVINGLTPQGQVPANSDQEIADGLSALANSPGLK
jgi:uncharacterized protein YidB (DUF937 family)